MDLSPGIEPSINMEAFFVIIGANECFMSVSCIGLFGYRCCRDTDIFAFCNWKFVQQFRQVIVYALLDVCGTVVEISGIYPVSITVTGCSVYIIVAAGYRYAGKQIQYQYNRFFLSAILDYASVVFYFRDSIIRYIYKRLAVAFQPCCGIRTFGFSRKPRSVGVFVCCRN